jgi:hypothetical protein
MEAIRRRVERDTEPLAGGVRRRGEIEGEEAHAAGGDGNGAIGTD